MAANFFARETVEQILKETVPILGDKAKLALLTLSTLNTTWAPLSRPYLLYDFILKGEEDALEYLDLKSSPDSTFPSPTRCERFTLKSSAMSEAGISALRDVVKSVLPPNHLDIHAIDGGIPKAIVRAFTGWANLQHLGISGGAHVPSTFFAQLKTFPHIKSLRLHNFRFASTVEGSHTRYTFPPGITRLSLSRSSSIWIFLQSHVIPGGGFDGIRELCIQARFCLQVEGVREMVECFRALRSLETLELDPIYNTICPDLRRTMNHIFQSHGMPLLRIHGLKKLRLKFAQVPAEFVFNVLIMSTIHLPSINTDMAIDISLPHSPALWDHTDPALLLRQLLVETRPRNTPDLEPESSITVRGFPGALPEGVETTKVARVCGYPVAFIDTEDTHA